MNHVTDTARHCCWGWLTAVLSDRWYPDNSCHSSGEQNPLLSLTWPGPSSACGGWHSLHWHGSPLIARLMTQDTIVNNMADLKEQGLLAAVVGRAGTWYCYFDIFAFVLFLVLTVWLFDILWLAQGIFIETISWLQQYPQAFIVAIIIGRRGQPYVRSSPLPLSQRSCLVSQAPGRRGRTYFMNL